MIIYKRNTLLVTSSCTRTVACFVYFTFNYSVLIYHSITTLVSCQSCIN